MAEQRKRGFHALEKRIHELEEEDAKRLESPPSEERPAKSAGAERSDRREEDAKRK